MEDKGETMTNVHPAKNFKEWLSKKAKEHLDRIDSFRRARIPVLRQRTIELFEAIDKEDLKLIAQRDIKLRQTFGEMHDWSPGSPLCRATGFHRTSEKSNLRERR